MTQAHTIGSLFSGIGGLELGLEMAGLGPVIWQAETDEDCRGWLADRWPDAVRYSDVRDLDADTPRPWLMCGGFPCQDLSVANQIPKGLDGAKSGLWTEYRRAIAAIRPRWVVVENVFAIKRWLPFVLRDLHDIGYPSLPVRLRACEVGAWHERSRCFVLACDGGFIRRDWSADLDWARRAATDADRKRRGKQWRHQTGAQKHAAAERCAATGTIPAWSGSAPLPALVRGVYGLPGRLAGRTYNGRIPAAAAVAQPGRNARVRALGNAVVPQCAEVLGRLILKVESEQ